MMGVMMREETQSRKGVELEEKSSLDSVPVLNSGTTASNLRVDPFLPIIISFSGVEVLGGEEGLLVVAGWTFAAFAISLDFSSAFFLDSARFIYSSR